MPMVRRSDHAALLPWIRRALLVSSLALSVAQANPIANAGFESGLSGWTLMGTAHLALVSDLTGKALRVSQRTSATDGVRQDLQAYLSGVGSGQTWVSRATVKLSQPASVRLFLSVSDSAGSKDVLLAERVVRATNQAVQVQGVSPIAWQGVLSRARLYLEVGQLAEGVFPDYTLDDLLIDTDRDADGLSDSEEALRSTDAAKADTDGDGMPDAWEVTHGLNPLLNDGSTDADGDGYTNVQEYWAASAPKDSASYPGQPSNPKLNPRAREVLKYLALLPSQTSNRVIAGQHVSDATSTDMQGYGYNVTALEQVTGKKLGMVELQYEGISPSAQYQISAVNQLAEAAWMQGKLVEIKWNPFIPWNNKSFNDTASFPLVDIAGMLAQNSSANQQAMVTFNGYLDTVAAGLDALQQKNVVVLWRFMSEMNGSWFWWGHRPQADYVALWRYIHNYLTVTKQLNNLIWVYESDAGVHGLMPSDYYFPGADVVDVVGHNFYSDTWNMPHDLDTLYRQYGKVYAFPQAGSASKSPVRAARYGWDNLVIINGIKARHPRASYFCVWNTFPQWPNTAAYISIVDEQNALALLGDPWVVTADEIPDFVSGVFSSTPGTVATPSETQQADAVFDWGQTNFPAYVAPPMAVSQSAWGYYYRYYWATDSFLASKDGRLWYYRASTGLLDLGRLTDFYQLAIARTSP